MPLRMGMNKVLLMMWLAGFTVIHILAWSFGSGQKEAI